MALGRLIAVVKHRSVDGCEGRWLGGAVIWDALKAAAEADPETMRLIIESAGIVVGPPNLSVCYDERGALCQF